MSWNIAGALLGEELTRGIVAVENPGSDVISSIGQVKVVFRNKKRIRRLQFRLVFEGNSRKRIGSKVKETHLPIFRNTCIAI